jgi:CBS domain-containing protein
MRTVEDIVGNRDPYVVDSGWSIRKVVEYLCEKKIGAVVVREGDRVVGVFSERDLMNRVILKRLDPDKTVVGDVMTKTIICVSPNEDYRIAKARMMDEGIRHLVVMGEGEQLMGSISMRQLIEVDLEEYKDLVTKLNDRYYQNAYKVK